MYGIGTYVMVHRRFGRTKLGSGIVKWASIVLAKSRLGQVVGLCTRYDGKVHSEVHYEGCANYFVPTKSHRFWLVRFGLMNKPVCVADDGMRLATIDEVEKLPLQSPRQTWSEQDKQEASEESKTWPRDKKGRWIKEKICQFPV